MEKETATPKTKVRKAFIAVITMILTAIVSITGTHMYNTWSRRHIDMVHFGVDGYASFRYILDDYYEDEIPVFTVDRQPTLVVLVDNPSDGSVLYEYTLSVQRTNIVFANYVHLIPWEGGNAPGQIQVNYLYADLSNKSPFSPFIIDEDVFLEDDSIVEKRGTRLKITSDDQNEDNIVLGLHEQGYYTLNFNLQYQQGKNKITKSGSCSFIYLEDTMEAIEPFLDIDFYTGKIY